MNRLQRMKKCGRNFICLLLVLSFTALSSGARLLPVAAAELTMDIGVNTGAVTATLKENGTLVISGAGEIADFTEDTAPFQNWNVTKVEIGTGITSIGDFTFYNCAALTETLVLPKNIVRIGHYAFSGASEAQAPKPSFIENRFTEALVTTTTGKTESTTQTPTVESTPQPEESATEEQPVESTGAEESAGAEVLLAEAETHNAEEPDEPAAEESAPAENTTGGETAGAEDPTDDNGTSAVESTTEPEEPAETPSESTPETDSSVSEETPAPTATPTPEAADTTTKNQYTVTRVTEQEIGSEIFYPRDTGAGVYTCSAENYSFLSAMEEAGYTEVEETVRVMLHCGEGNSTAGVMTTQMPVIDGNIIVPDLPEEFSKPAEESLFSYDFGGWTEQDDRANTVREVGSRIAVNGRNELNLIANWTKTVTAKIGFTRKGSVVTYAVPQLDGYDVLKYQWQTAADGTDWQNIAQATGQTYTRTLQKGDSKRLFRCLITVKKQQSAFFSLFSEAQAEELSLQAVGSGFTELETTLAVKKGSEILTATKTISVPVATAGSTYRITAATLPEQLQFATSTDELQADGKSFVFTVAPTGSGWSDTTATAQLTSQEETAETPHVVSSGIMTTTAAGQAELQLQLQYNGAYETVTPGTVQLTLEEFYGEEAKNQVELTVEIEDMTGMTQTVAVAAGRSFTAPSGTTASTPANRAITVLFETTFYPTETNMKSSKLYLQKDGAAVSFPKYTQFYLVDLSNTAQSAYYFKKITGNKTTGSGLAFSSIFGTSASSYPAYAAQNEKTTERLLFVIDFSNATTKPAAGEYTLWLAHNSVQDGATDPCVKAHFTIKEEISPACSISAKKNEEATTAERWAVDLTATCTEGDCWVVADLIDAEGNEVEFPEGVTVEGAQGVYRNEDGSLQFTPQKSQIVFDFSAANDFADGDYQLQLTAYPRPNLQNGGTYSTTASAALAERLNFVYEAPKQEVEEPAAERSLSVTADSRLLDATDKEVTWKLTLTTENLQEGDTVQVTIWKKTGTTPQAESYESAEGFTVDEATDTVTVTVPKGTEPGTYRAVVSILDANGTTVAQEPYNFILK